MSICNCHSVNVLWVCMIFKLQNIYSDSRWRSGCHSYTLHGLRSILYIILHDLILSVVDRKYITIHLYVSFRLGILCLQQIAIVFIDLYKSYSLLGYTRQKFNFS